MTDNQLLYCQRFLLLPSHCSSGGRGGVALTSHQVLSATVASSVLHATPLADTNYVQGNQHDSTLCTADRCASVFVSSIYDFYILLMAFLKNLIIDIIIGSKINLGLAWGRPRI
jgi:hypothetical protein